MAPHGGVMVSMTRMASILEIDYGNRTATVQPGLINLWLTHACASAAGSSRPIPQPDGLAIGAMSPHAGGRTA